MRKYRLLSFAFLLPLLASLLTGCWEEDLDAGEDILGSITTESDTPEEEPPAESAALTSFALPYFAKKTLDPVSCTDGAQQAVSSLLYEGLFVLDENLLPQNVLCSSYTYDAAAMTYTFSLQPGVTFSDGTPLSAWDVLATYQRAAASERYDARFANVKSMSVSGSDVVMVLSVDNAFFPALLDIPVVKSGTETASPPIGTGPYLLQNSENSDYLSANPDWWQNKSLPVDRIELIPNSDSETLIYQFNSREIQLLTTDLTGSDPLIVSGNVSFYDHATTSMLYVGFNVSDPLFSNPALRRAVSLGIDRDTVVSAYLSDHALPASYPISPLSSSYPTGEAAYSTQAFNAAMDALEVMETRQSVTLIVNEESAVKEKIADYIASALSDYMDVEVVVLPWADYLSRLQRGQFDMYLAEVRLTADYDVSSLIATNGAANYGGYSDQVMDAHLANFLSGSTSSITQFYNYFQQQTPIAPLCFKQNTVIAPTQSVTGLNPSVSTPFYQIENWQITLK